jgi:hypothetical protein
VLLLGGCSITVDSGADRGADGGADSPIDSVNRDDLAGDERRRRDTAFWRETSGGLPPSYRPPRVLGGYVGEDGRAAAASRPCRSTRSTARRFA